MGLRGKGAAMPIPAVFTPAEAMTLASDTSLALPGGRLFAFLLMTGCRWKEATWARWGRVNMQRATFDVVPPSKSEYDQGARVKRMKPRTVSLPAELVALLTRWHAASTPGDTFLFPAIWRTQTHVDSVRAFRANLEALGIPLADDEGKGRKIHSLRHTRQTIGIACGEDSLRLRLSMGHAGEDMGAHYSRLAMRFRALLSPWDGVLKLRDPSEVARIVGKARIVRESTS